jgi:MFS family permease
MSPARLTRDARMVLIGTCLNALGNGFVLPFLVIYLHEVRHLSLPVTGALISTEAAVGLLVVPLYGVIIDRFGARRVQLSTLAMSTIGALGLAVASSAPRAAAAMVFVGLGAAGFWPAAQALVAELVEPEARSRYFGLSFQLLNLGIGAGGVTGALIIRTGHPGTYQLLFLADAVTFLAFLVVLLPLRNVGRAHRRPDRDEPAGDTTSYRDLARQPAFRWVVAVQLLIVLAGYSQLDAAFPAFARQLGVSPRAVGFSFAVNTGVIVVGQMWVQRRSAVIRRTRALVLVSATWAGAWAFLGVAGLLPAGAVVTAMVIVFPGLFAFGEMLMSPVLPAIVNDLADDHVRGRYNAAVTWMWSVGNMIGPLVAGALLGAGARAALIVLVIAGCGVGMLCAFRLERVLPARANGRYDDIEDRVASIGEATALKVDAAPVP